MQASDAQASGEVTLKGRGLYNSDIVALHGLVAQHFEAVIRGGTIHSDGHIQVREVGSPAGAKTVVQLSKLVRLQQTMCMPDQLS